MNGNELLDKLALADPAFIEEAEAKAEAKPKRKHTWLKWGAAAAACIAAAAAAVTLIPRGVFIGSDPLQGVSASDEPEVSAQPAPIELSERSTVHVYYGYEGSVNKTKLFFLSEEEMFSMEDRCIFRGRVLELTNIILEYDEERMTRCIATIIVDKVYKGDIIPGGSVEVLLPNGVSLGGYPGEDCGIAMGIADCSEGIFMVKEYSEDEYETIHGGVIYLTDLAPYGITDGLRWMFLATDKALVFSRESYPGARSAKDLDDIEKYVLKMLGK